MRVYLTGFMASGKSTVGPEVADRLGYSFLDLDRRIVAQEGRSIPTIFAEDGESYFRRLERDALHETADDTDVIVALGGGALVDGANRSFAKEHGLVVYLKVDTETILERVGDEADRRPLLQDEQGTPLSPEQMQARIERMLSDRQPAYADAHRTVDATRAVSDVVDAVVAAVQPEGETSTTGRA